jgi:nucleoside-diphosphate-sugar epimerase
VVVTGAGGGLGQRVVRLLEDDPAVTRIVAVDVSEPPVAGPKVTARALDLATDDLAGVVAGADAVVHLAFLVGQVLEDGDAGRANAAATRRLLDAAGAAGVGHVVAMSSATVYGAWPSNPVPLTESAPVRPNPELSYAVQKAEIERLCQAFAAAHEGTSVTVLRPAVTVGGGEESWLAKALRKAMSLRSAEGAAPLQLVHVDDLAAAVDLARRQRLDGPVNVAADGWLDAPEVRSLAGAPPRLPLPAPAARALAAAGWRLRVGQTPPGVVAYTEAPWAVANDRIVAAGWKATHSNEEAYVVGTAGTPWSRLSPKRRQELSLGAAGVVLLGAGAGLFSFLHRRRRHRASSGWAAGRASSSR